MKLTLRYAVRIKNGSNFILDLSNLITSNSIILLLDLIHGISLSVLAIVGIVYGFQSCSDQQSDVSTFQGLKEGCLTFEIKIIQMHKISLTIML